MPAIRPLARLERGDHSTTTVAPMHSGVASRTVADVTRAAITDHRRLIILYDRQTPGEIAESLETIRSGCYGQLTGGGQLELLPALPLYLASGRLDPAAVTAWGRQVAADAEAAGWNGIIIAGQMSWATGRVSLEDLIAYEKAIDPVFPEIGVIGVCEYQHGALPAEETAILTELHPVIGLSAVTRGEDLESGDDFDAGHWHHVFSELERFSSDFDGEMGLWYSNQFALHRVYWGNRLLH